MALGFRYGGNRATRHFSALLGFRDFCLQENKCCPEALKVRSRIVPCDTPVRLLALRVVCCASQRKSSSERNDVAASTGHRSAFPKAFLVIHHVALVGCAAINELRVRHWILPSKNVSASMDGCRRPIRQLVPRPRHDQHTLVIGNPSPQRRLEHVIDHSRVILRDWPDIQRHDRPSLAEVHFMVGAEVILDRLIEPRVRWNQKHGMEVKASVAKGERGRVSVAPVDRQVGSSDQEGKFVGGRGPRLAVGPCREGRKDAVDLILHRLDDRAAWTGKLGEKEGQERGGPPIVNPVSDHSGEAIHELPVGGIHSADGIVLVDLPFGFDRVDRSVDIGLMMVGGMFVGIVLVGIGCGRPIAAVKTGHCEAPMIAGTVKWPIQRERGPAKYLDFLSPQNWTHSEENFSSPTIAIVFVTEKFLWGGLWGRTSALSQKYFYYQLLGSLFRGGEGGIRTPDRLAPMPHFECGAFNHSATSPGANRGEAALQVGASSRRGRRARQGGAGFNFAVSAAEKVGPPDAEKTGGPVSRH
jgi:hypothetical protein